MCAGIWLLELGGHEAGVLAQRPFAERLADLAPEVFELLVEDILLALDGSAALIP